MLAKVCDQTSIADLVNKHATICNTNDHFLLIKEKEGFRCFKVSDGAAFLSDYIIKAKRSIKRFDQKILIELLKEFHTG